MPSTGSAWISVEAAAGRGECPGARLRPPVTGVALAEAERAFGRPLHGDLKESLLHHDGEERDGGLLAGWRLLALAESVATWRRWNDLLAGGDFIDRVAIAGSGVQAAWWTPGWVPVAADGHGDFYCLDLEPTAGGVVGQVIVVWHDDPKRQRFADNLAGLLLTALRPR